MSYINVIPFDDTILNLSEKIIYLDTSVILEMVIISDDAKRQIEVEDFFDKITNQGAVTVSSIKCWEEVRIRLANMRINALRSEENLSSKAIIDANDGIMQMVAETASSLQEYFEGNLNHVISPEPISIEMVDKATSIMAAYDMMYPDALHSVIAAREQVDYIATLDADYSKIIELPFEVLTNTASYKKVMRKRSTST